MASANLWVPKLVHVLRLGILMNEPAQSIDPHDPHARCRSGRRDGLQR
jgi:hypothetical protein